MLLALPPPPRLPLQTADTATLEDKNNEQVKKAATTLIHHTLQGPSHKGNWALYFHVYQAKKPLP